MVKQKYVALFSALVLIICVGFPCLSGCSGNKTEDNGKLSVVATVFPAYDWARVILGEKGELTLLADNGTDLHSYEPTARDMSKIATCDMFIYVGGESDKWAEKVLKTSAKKDVVAVNLIDVLGDAVAEEEVLEGMEHDHDEDKPQDDEHVWLSLKNAQTVCTYIAEQLGEIDGGNSDIYTENAEKYNEKLERLDAKYKEAVRTARYDTLLFADRFPFRYLADDYGIYCYAAFSGCSAETEASVETIAFLSGKLSELNLPAVMIIDGSKGSIASTVIKTANVNSKILTLNSMQSVTNTDIANDVTYFSVMESNLNVLKEALN